MAESSISLSGPVFKAANVFSAVSNEVIEKTTNYGKGIIADKTPVRTGKAQNGWVAQGNTIYNDVNYVSFLEEGTKYMQGHFMVKRSLPAIRAFAVKQAASSLIKRLT